MITRREWLTSALALIAARVTPGCGSNPASTKTGDAGLAHDAGDAGADAAVVAGVTSEFDRLRALLAALKESPDHLAARAAIAVATKDPKLIFAFVRDNIAAVPPLGAAESIETAVRFGVDNLLRTGVGTPRERAELLATLLGQAGLSASIVKGDPAGALYPSDAPKKVYLRSIALAFEPGPLPFMPAQNAAAPTIIDPDGAESAALFAKLRPLLPADISVNTPYLSPFSGVPLVAVQDKGATVYLNTLLPDASYGESYATNIAPAAALAGARKLTLRLSATRAGAPQTPITLAQGEFGYDELAGARVKLSPQPTVSLPVFLAAKPQDITNFVAGFALIGSDGKQKRYIAGAAISAFGDVAETKAGTTTINGIPLVTGGDASTVSAVTAKASVAHAPIIELTLAPVDSNGAIVAGLPASSFVIEEDGVRVSALVRENGGAPRVLLLWDGTGSQPVLTDSQAGAIADAVFSAVPRAAVQVCSLDGAPSAAGFVQTASSAVKQALLGAAGATSPLYDGVLAGLAAGPSLMLVFTDGNDTQAAGRAAQFLATTTSCPILVIGCYVASSKLNPDALSPIAQKSGGRLVDAGDLTDLTVAKAALSELGASRSAFPYRLAYASRGAAGTHQVQVRVGRADASTSYTLTASTSTSGQPTSAMLSEFVGIQLHVEMDGQSVDRTLVGLPVAPLPGDVDASVQLAAASAAVRDFFLSSAWITFEGAAPTLSAWLDDALSTAIAGEPVQHAIDAKNAQEAYAQAQHAPARPLLRSLLAHAPLPYPDGVSVVETALRAAVHLTLPLSRRTSVDLLPTTRFTTLGAADGKAAFDTTFQASLRLAIAESFMSKGSTRSYLASAPLSVLVPGGDTTAALSGFPASARASQAALLDRYSSTYRILASDGSSSAFFAVDASSGTALGILRDGTGGAIESCQEIVDTANDQIDALGILVSEIDSGMVNTFVIIAAVGRAAAVAFAEAALSFTDPLIDPSILQLGDTIVCSVLGDILADHIPISKALHLGSAAENLLKSKTSGKITDQLPMCKAEKPCSGTAP